MALSPGIRKLVLTAHIVTSVGWLGAVLAYLPLDVIASASQDVRTVRAAFLAMEVTVCYVIVPLGLASVLIGIVNALGAPWGLLRHYWVVVKLLLTLFATTILLLEAQTIRNMAALAASSADPRQLPGSLPHSIGGSVVLLIITILSVYKPRGLTRHGWRNQQQHRGHRGEANQTDERNRGPRDPCSK